MKNKLSFVVAIWSILSATSLHALDLGVSYAVYTMPGTKPYVEVNLEIAAASVMYKHIDSVMMKAGVEVLILVKDGEKIVTYEKYSLNSPLVEQPVSLLDVKRMNVPEGKYTLEVTAQDVNDPANNDQVIVPFTVHFEEKITLSEVQLLRGFKPDNSESPFTKNGYFLEPLPFNFYDRGENTLAFYAEIYHSDKSVPTGKYRVRYVIEKEEANGQRLLISAGSQDKNRTQIDALLVQMDISNMESGNYVLIVELRAMNNELFLSRSLPFQRINPFLNISENNLTDEVLEKQFVQNLSEKDLQYCLRAISPLMTGDRSEALKEVLKKGDLKEMRFFLFRHFIEQSPTGPDIAFNNYMAVANAAQKKFASGFRYGFETDRGRTFLRFGQADDVVHVEDEPGAPPYEIWIYYKFPSTGQNNVKFLFYNPSLAGEDYILLHSNARGEIKNPKWERELYKRNPREFTDANYHDATTVERNVGRNARTYFEDF